MAPTLFDHGAKPGDLIEIFRGTYEHWAVYIGGNEVVHLIPPSDDSGSFGGLLMLLDDRRAQVRRQKIWEVVGRHRFEINNLLDHKYEPLDRHVIVRAACSMVSMELPYHAVTHNCEHFVTEATVRRVRVSSGFQSSCDGRRSCSRRWPRSVGCRSVCHLAQR